MIQMTVFCDAPSCDFAQNAGTHTWIRVLVSPIQIDPESQLVEVGEDPQELHFCSGACVANWSSS